MSYQTRHARRRTYRIPRERYAWNIVSRRQARQALRSLEALSRKGGA
ncbi:MAG TPA: hypothetical protein VMU54_20875 [Planctomycetota bacterium]|nr:hypothetical protein [Planctomycetota bacterium]